ncbi:MAG: cytochrome c biogenesis protein CcsA [Bacteroidaceae bacterium]|nr:cytochrome c biogenesis protein CcsA [Bacteroidaceae bacterium]
MKDGFFIGAGLIIAGLILELGVGPVDWDAFRWPVNGIVLAGFLVLVAIIFLLRKKVYGFQFIGTYKAAIPALVYAVVLTIVMGLTNQEVNGTWWNNMLSFWPFVLIYAYIAVILGQIILRRTLNSKRSTLNLKRDIPFLLNHLGLFLAMTTATLGNADMQRLKMMTVKGDPERRALTQEQQIVEMPFVIELKEFIMETYDDGKPKRFASDIQIQTKTGEIIQTTVEVNKPVEVDGWKIYQYGYDTQMGAMSQTSILELICDPWLPLVYTGIYMMLAGAVCFILLSIPWAGGWRQTRKHPRRAIAIAVVIAAAFFCVHHFMPILHSDTLVPALQSPWFKPHIIAYMLAYTLMASATVIALYLLLRSRQGNLDNLVRIGISLITIGMLFGALWAKEAWGHYWSWDPKETWAAITWFAYLVYVHYRQIPIHKPKLALWILFISFVLLQMCWWGINYLPSAQGSSVHVYNMPS